MKKYYLGFLILCLFVCTGLVSSKSRAGILSPDNVSHFEGEGVKYKSSIRLPSDIWNKDLTRAEIYALVDALPIASENVSVRHLVYALLLNEERHSEFQNDQTLPQDIDYLSIRIQKLVKMGAYSKAIALYRQTRRATNYPVLLKSGVAALIYNGNIGSACIDIKTGLKNFSEEEDLLALDSICADLANDNATKDKLSYSKIDFKKPFSVESLKQIAGGVLSYNGKHNEFFTKISPGHYSLFLGSDVSPALELKILAKAAELGQIEQDQIFQSVQNIQKRIVNGAKADKTTTTLIEKIVEVHNHPDDQPLQELMALTSPKYLALLMPFYGDYQSISTDDLSREHLIKLAKLDLLMGFSPKHELILKIVQKGKSFTDEQLYAVLSVGDELSAKNIQNIFPSDSSGNANTIFDKLLVLSVIQQRIRENHPILLGYDIIFDKAEEIVYEKGRGLTLERNYVMPIPAMWHRFSALNKNSSVGENVALASVLLGNQSVGNIYPGLWDDVTQRLETVETINGASLIFYEAILTMIKNK